ncbi:KH domain-containing protein akap-1-like [Oppia nitens]|uniref:KH domain-containing protein akap-1-like n=1 Tax=Oppia nitens TaxID=1686743 RepID=UPI0023DA1701|nr:KH domain-containing protein akap-1-like [Oppia nitens]
MFHSLSLQMRNIINVSPIEEPQGLHMSTPHHHHNHQHHSTETVVYQFEIPQYLCGRLIGEKGRFVMSIKYKTNVSVVVNRHYFVSDMKICTLTGIRPAIKEALNMIRKRFPIQLYPSVSLQQINLLNTSQTCALPQTCQLQLPSGISCDVILSSLVSAGHFFLQQPTHPTYPSLNRLDYCMNQTYSQDNTPQLPNIQTGMICAVPLMGGWFRAVIIKVHSNDECDVMFVDYGGFSRLPVSTLRQIRFDFMTLPFQTSECHLANVEPIDPEIGWTQEANLVFEELAQGQILQAIVVGYTDSGIPLVNLFKIQGVTTIFINDELIKRSHAQWTNCSTSSDSGLTEEAVETEEEDADERVDDTVDGLTHDFVKLNTEENNNLSEDTSVILTNDSSKVIANHKNELKSKQSISSSNNRKDDKNSNDKLDGQNNEDIEDDIEESRAETLTDTEVDEELKTLNVYQEICDLQCDVI